jgi:HEPN domain-containing protein
METEYKNWLEIATSDLLTAKLLIGQKDILPAISVYHSHQCVEKALKAVLIAKKLPNPKIHNLNYLLNQATIVFPTLKQYEDACAVLNESLPKLRYPTGDRFTKEDAQDCYRIAKMILANIKTLPLSQFEWVR